MGWETYFVFALVAVAGIAMPSEVEVVAPARKRAPIAVVAVLAMVVVSALNIVPVFFKF